MHYPEKLFKFTVIEVTTDAGGHINTAEQTRFENAETLKDARRALVERYQKRHGRLITYNERAPFMFITPDRARAFFIVKIEKIKKEREA